ncbi:MAG: hypothetical protein P4M09_17120 [Devosia sp.]|nr:hypothetical protein [Devosia sp.]
MPDIDVSTAQLHFFDLLERARAAGKDWWADLQIRQIEEFLWKDKKIKALQYALEMVRDADDDCKADGGQPIPIPPVARARIDKALAMALLKHDPNAVSLVDKETF